VLGSESLLDLAAQRSVAVAAERRVLEKRPLVGEAGELLGVEEVVVAPLLLALAGLAGGRRHRQLELRDALA
jgi:hypothetical protein